MKRAMFLMLALAIAPAAHAQLYKHVDKNGRVTYSDQPPLDADSKALNLPRSVTDAPTPKSYVARDKELDKKRKETSEKASKAEEAAQVARANQERCQQARQNFQLYRDGGRIYRTNEKGEREFMSDADIDAARERSRREMDEACKDQ